MSKQKTYEISSRTLWLAGFLIGTLCGLTALNSIAIFANKDQIRQTTTKVDKMFNLVVSVGQQFNEAMVKVQRVKQRQNNLECMAKNLWFEASNQDIQSKMAIAQVVRNRVTKPYYANSICDVVYETKWRDGRHIAQFSWFSDGKPDTPKIANPIDQKAWDLSVSVADAYIDGDFNRDPDLAEATMYHATYVTPNWDWTKLEYLKQVGDHKFYRELR